MTFPFERWAENPIVRPGRYPWRLAAVFNPGVVDLGDRVLMLERAAGGLRPFHCYLGLLESRDGIHFEHVTDEPVFTPAMAGSPFGSVQDPRVVKIDDTLYLTYAFRPYAWNSHPTGVGVPESFQAEFPGFSGDPAENRTRSGIAVSRDGLRWKHHAWATPRELDDRDVILFPEKIGGRFALLRRPLEFVGPAYGTDKPGIWLTFSEDLVTWSDPVLLAAPRRKWEGDRIGGSTPPIPTEAGWLVFYHGVETVDPARRRVVYRLGAMVLDRADPRRVLARTRNFLMEPEAYYECTGLYIPLVIFPTGAIVREGRLYLYYGVADTAIALATADLDDLLAHLLES